MTQITSAPSLEAAPRDSDTFLWDFAGVDGLQAAIALFTPAISRLAPFQSLTAEFDHQPCSVLRLCDNNFRVALPGPMSFDATFEAAIAALPLNIWVKPCPAAVLVLPVDFGLARLSAIATIKPIYRLSPFPCERAVPARINGLGILAWHHCWRGQPRLEIQTAQANIQRIYQEIY